jgi:hypothetical protein
MGRPDPYQLGFFRRCKSLDARVRGHDECGGYNGSAAHTSPSSATTHARRSRESGNPALIMRRRERLDARLRGHDEGGG